MGPCATIIDDSWCGGISIPSQLERGPESTKVIQTEEQCLYLLQME